MCQQQNMKQQIRQLLRHCLVIFFVLNVMSISACTSNQTDMSTQGKYRGKPQKEAGGASNVLSASGRYHALVIGNQHYQHLKPLQTPIADAEKVASLLKDQYGFNVTLLLDANKQQITEAISDLVDKLSSIQDNLLIYYAGHGAVDNRTGVGYWQPIDAKDRENDFLNWVSNHDITTTLQVMQANHVLIVADSCYSAALLRGDTNGQQLPSDVKWQTWLERMQQKRSRTALTAGGDEPVADSGGSGHSVFAKAFIDALGENQCVLDGNSLFDQLKTRVVSIAEQTPHYNIIPNTGVNDGDFLFFRKNCSVDTSEKFLKMPYIYVGKPWRGHVSNIKIVHNGSTFDLAQQLSDKFNNSELNSVELQAKPVLYAEWVNNIRNNFARLKEDAPDYGGYNIFYSDNQKALADEVQRIVNPLLKDKQIKSTSEDQRIMKALEAENDELLIVLNSN